tara:strand:+ start:238 stop:981 length:744 start_codon:yes stop_codon:yes gene_type:complete
MKIQPKKYDLLTTGNPKILKGQKEGYLSAILHLSPSTLNDSKIDLCPNSSKGCRQACLNTAGRGFFDQKVKNARRRKSNDFINNSENFVYRLACEIAYYDRQAKRKGLVLVVRLNGTSDINWNCVEIEGKTIFELCPTIQFYDYTKDPEIVTYAEFIPNYHVTFSHSGENEKMVNVLKTVVNIAVPFQVKKGETLPATFYGLPVIDGDQNDLRFLDQKNVVVGLRVKGIKQKKQVNSFIITIEKKVA